jgi:hypothetical protein
MNQSFYLKKSLLAEDWGIRHITSQTYNSLACLNVTKISMTYSQLKDIPITKFKHDQLLFLYRYLPKSLQIPLIVRLLILFYFCVSIKFVQI